MAFGFEKFFEKFGAASEQGVSKRVLHGTDIHHPRTSPEHGGFQRGALAREIAGVGEGEEALQKVEAAHELPEPLSGEMSRLELKIVDFNLVRANIDTAAREAQQHEWQDLKGYIERLAEDINQRVNRDQQMASGLDTVHPGVEKLLVKSNEIYQHRLESGNFESNQERIHQLRILARQMKYIYDEVFLDNEVERPNTDERTFAENLRSTDTRLADYNTQELAMAWKEEPDFRKRIDFIYRQQALIDTFLEDIDELGGSEQIESMLQDVAARNLILEDTNKAIREQLERKRARDTLEISEDYWLRDRFLGYHELLVALERLWRQLRDEREER